jgi:hypothetical protein
MTILRASNQWPNCRGINFSRGINFPRPLYCTQQQTDTVHPRQIPTACNISITDIVCTVQYLNVLT